VSLVGSVKLMERPVARLEPVIGAERHARLVKAADEFRERLAGRTIWNVVICTGLCARHHPFHAIRGACGRFDIDPHMRFPPGLVGIQQRLGCTVARSDSQR
jgi:hypothetical protein